MGSKNTSVIVQCAKHIINAVWSCLLLDNVATLYWFCNIFAFFFFGGGSGGGDIPQCNFGCFKNFYVYIAEFSVIREDV